MKTLSTPIGIKSIKYRIQSEIEVYNHQVQNDIYLVEHEMVEHKLINELNLIFGDAHYSGLKHVQSKDGISVYRLNINEKSVVVKLFTSDEFKREMPNYELLNFIGVPTIKVLGKTDSCICLEDINCSELFRLGAAEDLNDVCIARSIAQWYKHLHVKGIKAPGLSGLYRESDVITLENLKILNTKVNNKVWQVVIENLNKIYEVINNLGETITYNDFYWTNLVVSKDKKAALMFDYNLLGRGYCHSDIRNVCSSLSDAAKEAFLDEYGDINNHEAVIDECISPIVTLIFAFKRDTFPSWASESLKAVKSGELMESVKKILNLC